ncbi:2647_t:CDS:2 [Dentiscutata heterogama]|uniref:2647_t:CDS:1 n=1 Tax=Dentiscutata heterogama TaxID=1316150 RepID=A0ACA9KUK9_9GLOM|nr:2647_t:CDS:2 [Dentiscutata heterogama]
MDDAKKKINDTGSRFTKCGCNRRVTSQKCPTARCWTFVLVASKEIVMNRKVSIEDTEVCYVSFCRKGLLIIEAGGEGINYNNRSPSWSQIFLRSQVARNLSITTISIPPFPFLSS